jgi:hypothetical protein
MHSELSEFSKLSIYIIGFSLNIIAHNLDKTDWNLFSFTISAIDFTFIHPQSTKSCDSNTCSPPAEYIEGGGRGGEKFDLSILINFQIYLEMCVLRLSREDKPAH